MRGPYSPCTWKILLVKRGNGQDDFRARPGWSAEDGLVSALQEPISIGLFGGVDFSWLAGIVVAGGVYLALGRGTSAAPIARPAE